MLRINQIKIEIGCFEGLREGDPGFTEKESQLLLQGAAKLLRQPKQCLKGFVIRKKSLDARKDPICYVYSLDVSLENESAILRKNRNPQIQAAALHPYSFPSLKPSSGTLRPVVTGSGPAGLFCAYGLAAAGLNPLILERGEPVEKRVAKVERFWKEGLLDPDCNVQFGEGGAGTFSDGKLGTMIKESGGRHQKVLEIFVRHGAPEEIQYVQKPHIGTDRLRKVVSSMRRSILSMGGQFRFQSCLTDICIRDGKLESIVVNGTEEIPCSKLVLAVGHSARDTFSMLLSRGVAMGPKPFAIGLRLEHRQEWINRSQYRSCASLLPPADYKLTCRTGEGRGVYSFCMCPGGFVVNASSEPDGLVVNGMSNYDRGGENANSAIVVTVTEEDVKRFCPDMAAALSGVEFQRLWEHRAYRAAGGKVPVQTAADFMEGRNTGKLGSLLPQIKGAYAPADLNDCLPDFVVRAIREAIPQFNRKIKGYFNPESVFSGVETRTSSPVRIYRNEKLLSNIQGIYPCGEGAGYAGGITSSAVDGLKVYEAVAGFY